MSVPTAEEATARLEEYGRANPCGIAAVYSDGSVARGAARHNSDVDVAVLFDRDPPHTLEGLHADLAHAIEEALGERVDLGIVRDVLEHRLDDLFAFVRAIRARLVA